MKKSIVFILVLSSFVLGESFTNSVGMKFVDIPAGKFIMGKQMDNCPKDDPYTDKNENEECVNNSKNSQNIGVESFYMQDTEVTQEQWFKIMGTNPSKFKTGNASK
jgi:formylglycine-generating enzyme required for sulfatase activity